MSGGAVAAIVLGSVVVVGGGGLALYLHGRRQYLPPLPAGRVVYGNVAAKAGPDLTSKLVGAIGSIADAYVSSDAGSEQIAGWLGGS